MKELANYHKEMQQLLSGIPLGERLLLHSCCGPCSSSVLEQLAAHFTVTLLYYNPNIWPEAEYQRRQEEQKTLLGQLYTVYPVQYVELPYEPKQFYIAAAGLEAEPERGARCTQCFTLRLDTAAKAAREMEIPWLTTTLTVSPHKNAALLNEIGQAAAGKQGIRFLPSDFKKANGYKRSLELSAEYGLYRQEYCGCEFSYNARFGSDTLDNGPKSMV